MGTLIQIAAGAALFAFSFWLSLRILASECSKNTPGTAVFVGIVFSVAGHMIGYPLMVLPLLALMYLLIQYYDLGLIRSFLVIGLMGLTGLGVNVLLSLLHRGLPIAVA